MGRTLLDIIAFLIYIPPVILIFLQLIIGFFCLEKTIQNTKEFACGIALLLIISILPFAAWRVLLGKPEEDYDSLFIMNRRGKYK